MGSGHELAPDAASGFLGRPVVAVAVALVGLAATAVAVPGLVAAVRPPSARQPVQAVPAAPHDPGGPWPSTAPPPATDAPMADEPPGDHHRGDAGSYLLRAADQDGDGRTVLIEEVVLTGHRGWAVLHADVGGAPGPVIGVSGLLPEGRSQAVRVPLTTPLESPSRVFAMLHLDDNGNGAYDFPNGDFSARVDGLAVMFPLTVTVRR